MGISGYRRRFSIKKLVFCCFFTILTFLLLTCDLFSPGEGSNTNEKTDRIVYTDVVYSEDGKSLTLYLDGPVPVLQSRSLSKELAVAGHDYFEVVFYSFVDEKTVRRSWELYKDAGIRGITREYSSGNFIDYQYTSVADANAVHKGAAILFVGKKTDKTLLAVGRLFDTDDSSGTSTVITNNTKSVTFQVAALETGTLVANDSRFADECSFFTNYSNLGANPQPNATAANSFTIFERQFPLFGLRENNKTKGTFSFRTNGHPAVNIDQFSDGIILAGPAEYMRKQPRYSVPGGGFQYYSLRLDERTEISPLNNTAIDAPFTNPLLFEFDTAVNNTVSGSVFALVFQVPVYPISKEENLGKWFIRGGYDSYWLDLDDGKGIAEGGPGGAVLIGTGDPAQYSDYVLVLIRSPTKWRYGPVSASIPTGYQFLVDGMLIQLQRRDGTAIRYVSYEELSYYVGGWELRAGWSQQPPPASPAWPPPPSTYPPSSNTGGPAAMFPSELYGLQLIKVVYIDPYSGIESSVTFPILTNGGDPLRDFTSIPDDHTIYIRRSVYGSIQGALNALVQGGESSGFHFSGGPGTYLIILGEDIDLDPIVQQEANASSQLIIVMSAKEDVKLGRPTVVGDSAQVFIDWGRRNAYYFGVWPFSDSLRAHIFDDFEPGNHGGWLGTPGTSVLTDVRTMATITPTYPYTINAAGPVTNRVNPATTGVYPPGAYYPPDVNWPAGPAPAQPPGFSGHSRFFIRGGNGGRIYNVTVDSSITVLNDQWFH